MSHPLLAKLAYGSYGMLFLAGVILVTYVTVGRVTESAVKAVSDIDLPRFLLILTALLVVAILFLTGSLAIVALTIGFAVIVLLPLAFYMLIRNEITRRNWKKEEEAAEIAKFKGILAKGADAAVGHIGLARVFERYERFLEAAQEYHIVGEMFAGDDSAYSERMAQKESLTRKAHEAIEKAKTYICPFCQGRNRPQQRRCAKCGRALYRNGFMWMWKNTSVWTRGSALAVIVISLLYAVWLPFTLSLALMALWLFLIVYFSLPLDAVLSDS
jgi:ABC-type multidrug transport system fused ATPase/permease subunit